MTTTRERALSDALYAIVQRCSATLPDDCDYARWRRQSASSIGELLNNARAALALPPDAPPAAPVADGKTDPIDILHEWCAWHYRRYGDQVSHGAPLAASNAAIARATGREG